MKKISRNILIILAAVFLATACTGNFTNGSDDLTASGTISAISVSVAPELSGKIMDINIKEGESVEDGEILFTLDSEYLESQFNQANAALTAAEAGLETAKVQSRSANLQLEMAKQNSRFQFADALTDEYNKTQPGAFDLPVWYFEREEEITAAEAIVERAGIALHEKEGVLEDELADIVNSDFIALETELLEAQNLYIIYDNALDIASIAGENEQLKDASQDAFDLYETSLEEVQARYDQALNTDAADRVLEARGEVSAAQIAYDEAVNYLMSFYIGDDALEVQAATIGVELADKNVEQAEANVTQAEAAVQSIEIQLEKTKVISPIAGEVLAQDLEEGELISAGSTVMTIGNIDEVKLTVYIPEDKFGRVNVGQEVRVTVDSFPEKVYMGTVTYIADSAEFTPSNVQTVEGRKATVFAVDISITNTNHDLKPGMPADVTFIF